jgi:hypothetical protein
LVPLVRLDEQFDDAGLHHAARDRDVNGVGPLAEGRNLAPGREQPLEEQIDAAALALLQLQVVEDAREAVVSAAALVEELIALSGRRGWGPGKMTRDGIPGAR